MNLALGGNASKLAWGVGILGSLSIIVSATYLTAPTIREALDDQGYRLISESQDKEELYGRSFRRYRNILIDMNIDGQMGDWIEDDEGSIALSLWCDHNLSKKRFFVSTSGYKQFCSLSMGDVLWLDKKDQRVLDIAKFLDLEKQKRFSKELFPKLQLTFNELKEAYDIWKNWCEFELSKPYFFESGRIKNIIKVNCLMDDSSSVAK
ncbi:hypothetical protein MHF_0824 [Mycoplasma haemofelis Ohio2]|uniref:Uncharacterized protein n=1 Tax=Mycoplasma haemofelis (strain Ohio2) TaxID=859194 RepID=F6FIP0_MYCHI|nr:hypothetical protein MHF_0824 [Mycoplasma haemofelis Ohio2]